MHQEWIEMSHVHVFVTEQEIPTLIMLSYCIIPGIKFLHSCLIWSVLYICCYPAPLATKETVKGAEHESGRNVTHYIYSMLKISIDL